MPLHSFLRHSRFAKHLVHTAGLLLLVLLLLGAGGKLSLAAAEDAATLPNGQAYALGFERYSPAKIPIDPQIELAGASEASA
eukprot:COSAG04_NODE_6819_length_1249_cov_1.013043_2_plen_81_part_01